MRHVTAPAFRPLQNPRDPVTRFIPLRVSNAGERVERERLQIEISQSVPAVRWPAISQSYVRRRSRGSAARQLVECETRLHENQIRTSGGIADRVCTCGLRSSQSPRPRGIRQPRPACRGDPDFPVARSMHRSVDVDVDDLSCSTVAASSERRMNPRPLIGYSTASGPRLGYRICRPSQQNRHFLSL